MNLSLSRVRFLNLYPWIFALSALVALGADPPEVEQAYNTALSFFKDKFYEQAKKEFAGIVERFPDSSRTPEAILLQAQCLYELKDFDAVVGLLDRRINGAGTLRNQYRFWLAEAEFSRRDFAAAAKVYEDLLRASTNSTLRLQASYGEAASYFEMRDYDRTISLLNDPAKAFQQEAKINTNDTSVVRGYLLLGDAYFYKKDYRTAEQVLKQLAVRRLSPELDWERQYLLATSAWAGQRRDEALATATNLVVLASNTNLLNKPVLLGNSLMLLADVLKERDPNEAIEAYDRITKIKGIPSNQNQQAILRTVDLLASQNRFTNAVQRLQTLLIQTNQDSPEGLLRLTLGDLHLKQFYGAVEKTSGAHSRTNLAVTTFLQQAKAQFDFVITNLTNSPLLGKAYLNRGWCLWEEAQFSGAPEKISDSQSAFQAAVDRLPGPEDQAVARFKLADCQFQRHDYTNAIGNYRFLIEKFADHTEVKLKWFPQAFYQIVRASLEIRDLPSARNALKGILDEFPTSEFAGRSVLNFATALFLWGNPANASEARETLANFEKRIPVSPVLPEVHLAIARSYLRETNWTEAIRELDGWLAIYTNHAFRPNVEFDRALTYYRAGHETNALLLFTNFVTQFPTNQLTPWAQFWAGDYFYNRQDNSSAGIYYQLVFQSTNSVAPELRVRSGLRAARAALLRYEPSTAKNYLTNLINNYFNKDTNRQPELEAEAWFILADAELMDPSAPGLTNRLKNFESAIQPLKRITNFLSQSKFAILARGKLANCYLQMAVENSKYYGDATNEFSLVMESPVADITTRSQAEFGLAFALEKIAEQKSASEQSLLLKQALTHYLNILYNKRVATDKGERPDPFWVSKAGEQAGKVAERLRMTEQAIIIYEHLLTKFPQLRKLQPNLKKRLDDLKLAGAQ